MAEEYRRVVEDDDVKQPGRDNAAKVRRELPDRLPSVSASSPVVQENRNIDVAIVASPAAGATAKQVGQTHTWLLAQHTAQPIDERGCGRRRHNATVAQLQ
jgi:hypothetical protein